MKTIFITGMSSGLGEAAVHLFHNKGWNVIATMRNVAKVKSFIGLERVTVLPLDITEPPLSEVFFFTLHKSLRIFGIFDKYN